jgi:hypothetical protein
MNRILTTQDRVCKYSIEASRDGDAYDASAHTSHDQQLLNE